MRKWFLGLLLLSYTTAFSQTDFHAKVKLLQRFLQLQHYQPITWNDSSSAMLYNKWIKGLDDEKLLFSQKDIDQLSVLKYRLDDEINGTEWQFFDQSVALYQRKVKLADSLVKQILLKPFDLTKPASVQWPFTTYAASDQELNTRWQQFLQWQVLRQVAEKLADTNGIVPAKSAVDAAVERAARARVSKREQARFLSLLPGKDSLLAQMQDDYLNDIAWCYDPHTTYMNEASRSEFETEMSAAEYSVGMGIFKNDNGDIEINYLQPGGSAWRSGQLHAGDIVLKIKTENHEEDVTELSEDDVEELLHSARETTVALTIKTKAGETKLINILKEKTDSEEAIVKSFVIRGKQNIGYIDLPGFYSRDEELENESEIKDDGCANDVSKEIIKLKKDSIAGLILDLRFNGGGSMWEAVQLAGIFIDIGPVASTKDKEAKVRFLKDPNRGTIYDGPLIVLVNGASASASEFLSAALQDYNRALIVGENTYGKGTAQSIMPLDTAKPSATKKYTDFVKVTGGKFYRVNGSTVQWQGVLPDITVRGFYDWSTQKEKLNESALKPDKTKQGIYQAASALPVDVLAEKSKARLQNSEYYKSVNEVLTWQQQFRQPRKIPLNWSEYLLVYNSVNTTLAKLGGSKSSSGKLEITNNKFEEAIIQQLSQQKKETNKLVIQSLQKDPILAEAYQILQDWNNK